MLSGYSATPMSNLFTNHSENASIFNGTPTESSGPSNSDLSQVLKPLCLPPSWLSAANGVEDRSRTNLIINYLPQSYDQSDLQRLFERLGPIRQCKLIRDKNTGASLCYGFVDYISPQHAALAIQTYHGYETESKRLRVAYASSGGRRFFPGQRTPTCELNSLGCMTDTTDNIVGWEICVSGLPSEVSETDLMRLFSHFGSILSVRFLPSEGIKPLASSGNGALADITCNATESALFGARSNAGKGSTTSVIFEDRSSCDTAIGRLNGLQLPDCPSPLCLRLVGPVTRETYAMLYLVSRQDQIGSALPSRPFSMSQTSHGDKLSTPVLGGLNGFKVPQVRAILESNEPNENLLPSLNGHSVLSSRPIKSKNCTGSTLLDSLDFADILDGGAVSSSIQRSGADRFSPTCTQNFLSKPNPHACDIISKSDTSSHLSWNRCPSPQTSVDIFRASVRQQEVTFPKRLSIVTPLLPSSQMSAALSSKGGRANILLKLENLQPTGSVLLRGMEYACRKFASLGGAQHIVCPSTGNAGVAAAFAAQSFGMACTIITPEGNETLTRRRLAIEAPSAKLVSFGTNLSEASRRAEQMVADANEQLHQINGTTDAAVRFLHPYDSADVVTGYESIVEELPNGQQPDLIVTSVGGGGVLAGIIQGLWSRGWASTHILAVETEGADCLARSVAAGHPVVISRCSSVASSLCAPSLSMRAWNMLQCYPVTSVTCSDLEAVSATRRFLDDHGILVEPACGAALSAVYTGTIAKLQNGGVIPRPANVCIIICGGRNVNLQMLADFEQKLSCVPLPIHGKPLASKPISFTSGVESLFPTASEPLRSHDENVDQFSDILTNSSSMSPPSDANPTSKAAAPVRNDLAEHD